MREAQVHPEPFDPAAATLLVVVFAVGIRRCAIALNAVERVIAAVESGPLSGAPAAVFGLVNLHGAAVPILDVRPRFGDPAGPLRLDSKFLIIRTPQRLMALLADAVEGVRVLSAAAILQLADLAPGAGMVQGCAAGDDGLIYLYDADQLLTAPDEELLAAALDGRRE